MLRLVLPILLFAVLSACASPREQHYLPTQITPGLTADHFIAGDGAALPLRRWLPSGQPQAVIVALHGFNDYSNAFDMPARYFAGQGIVTYAYDQRGFGDTPQRGIWAGSGNLASDLIGMVQAVKQAHPGLPVYVLGESMGGAVAIAALTGAAAPQHLVDGVILSAPAVWGDESLPVLYRAALWIATHTVPGMTVTGEGLDVVASDNIPMLIALGQDPLVLKETRIDAIWGLTGLMDEAYDRAAALRVPTLIIYGEKDQIIPSEPVGQSFAAIPQARLALYPDGYHMLLRDLQAATVWRDIVAWMAQPGRALPSGHEKTQALREADALDRLKAEEQAQARRFRRRP